MLFAMFVRKQAFFRSLFSPGGNDSRCPLTSSEAPVQSFPETLDLQDRKSDRVSSSAAANASSAARRIGLRRILLVFSKWLVEKTVCLSLFGLSVAPHGSVGLP